MPPATTVRQMTAAVTPMIATIATAATATFKASLYHGVPAAALSCCGRVRSSVPSTYVPRVASATGEEGRLLRRAARLACVI